MVFEVFSLPWFSFVFGLSSVVYVCPRFFAMKNEFPWPARVLRILSLRLFADAGLLKIPARKASSLLFPKTFPFQLLVGTTLRVLTSLPGNFPLSTCTHVFVLSLFWNLAGWEGFSIISLSYPPQSNSLRVSLNPLFSRWYGNPSPNFGNERFLFPILSLFNNYGVASKRGATCPMGAARAPRIGLLRLLVFVESGGSHPRLFFGTRVLNGVPFWIH